MSFGGIGSSSSLGNSLAHSWATGNFGADDTSTEHSIAASHLKKLGWKHGQGLGKRGDGINRAISVGFKNDSKGIGASSNEFGFSWWDHVFNKAASQIKIEKDSDDEVKVKVRNQSLDQSKKLLYGSFTVAGAEVEEKDYSMKVTDAELFAACEGRTARRGARVEQPGKLERTRKKSEEIQPIASPEKEEGKKERKKGKKKKLESETEVKEHKKKRKRNDSEEILAEEKLQNREKSKNLDIEEQVSKPKKSKKSKSKNVHVNATETE